MIGKKYHRAFSLIELIMTIVIIGTVAAIGVPMLMEVADAWSLGSLLQNNAVYQAQVTTSRMFREIRRLSNITSVGIANTTFYEFRDINNATINYTLSNSTLTRNSIGLASNVTSLNFTYYNDTGSVIATPTTGYGNTTNIRLVEVDVIFAAGSNNVKYQFQIRPQNTPKYNEKFK